MGQVDELLTAGETASILGISVPWLYQLRSAGRGPVSTRRGRRLQYRRSDIDAYLVRERERSVRGEGLDT